MADVRPFAAVRPARELVSIMVSRSYDTYLPSERNARMKANPFSFLHIINPGFKYQKKLSGQERFEMVRNRYLEFKEEGNLIQDPQPCYYIYQIIDRDGHTYRGIIAAVSTEDYQNNVVKRHEDTLAQRETLFTEYLHTVGFNAEPILLTYPPNDPLEEIMDQIVRVRAEYEFTTTFRDTHYLWPVSEEAHVKGIKSCFSAMQQIYIADGHHRCASSVRLAEQMKENPLAEGQDSYNYFMSFLIPESDLRIEAFYRMVKDLNGLSKEALLIKLDEFFRIENRGVSPYASSKKHHFGMYLDGEFYSLYLRKFKVEFQDALQALDSQLLLDTILEPILGIKDPRTDKRLSYHSEREGKFNIKDAVDSGKFAVGFSMVPVNIEELKAVADQQLTMPPKSTYIMPKLRSGITIYEF